VGGGGADPARRARVGNRPALEAPQEARRVRRDRARGEPAGEARPEQKGELEAIHAELAKAIQALKGSSPGGGRDALAVLPWYMIIGPSNTGKSTALRASGLRFPYLSKRGGVRGVGGTRNCDWWLTNDAVLVDTAGRYATEDEDREDRRQRLHQKVLLVQTLSRKCHIGHDLARHI